MIEALAANKIKGAALDVFTTEPLPIESELWDLPNLLLSPHNADLTVRLSISYLLSLLLLLLILSLPGLYNNNNYYY